MSDFEWMGYEWLVQRWDGAPTFNKKWSGDNVILNPDGTVTMKITNPSGTEPYAASMESIKRAWGYGTYQVTVEGDFDNMPASVVLGNVFTYDGTIGPGSSANEIDIGEVSAWGATGQQPEASTTVWHDDGWRDGSLDGIPDNENGYIVTYPTNTPVSTFVFVWEPDRVSFYSYKGHGTSGDLIAQGFITDDVPVPRNEAVAINLWVVAGGTSNPATTGPWEVKFHEFSFTPLQGYEDFSESVRLEIEEDPTGLVNIVPNPSGEKGAWNWVSPVSETVVKSEGPYDDGMRLVFESGNDDVPVYYYTDPLPVDAGQWVAGRATPRLYSANTAQRLRFEFLDAAGAVISSSTPTAQSSVVNEPIYISAAQAPTGTEYVRLRIDVYSSAGGNPPLFSYVHFNEFMVTHADTVGDLATVRTNLIRNPSFESDLSQWRLTGTVTRTTGTAWDRTYGATLTSGSEIAKHTSGQRIPVVGGEDYTLSFYAKTPSTAGDARVRMVVNWYREDGALLKTSATKRVSLSTAWGRRSLALTAPNRAASAAIYLTALNRTCHIDGVMFEAGATLRPYFDGATTDTAAKTYDWTGTAETSTSSETIGTSSFDFVEPVQWRNILGPAHEIKVHREGLDVGTLSAVIRDSDLDPSVADTIRPGKQVRLMGNSASSWRPIFTGRLDGASVTYSHEAPDPARRARIEIVALDNVTQLAGVKRDKGVATIDELPFVLEGAGVPWNCNGSGSHAVWATVASKNDGPTALDQVGMTRDTALGYAWVDTDGVLQAWDTLPDSRSLINPGFEDGVDGWYEGYGTLTTITSDRHSGARAARFQPDGTGRGRVQTNINVNPLEVEPGLTYTVSAWYKVPTTLSQDYRLSVEFYSDFTAWNYLGEAASEPIRTANGWEKRQITFKVPSGCRNVMLYLLLADGSSTNTTDVILVDDAEFLGTTLAVTEEDYLADADISFDTRDAINEVMVKWLRYYPNKQVTKEFNYGPYRDASSIDRWGPRSATYTIQGTGDGEAAAEAYAARILAANATPKVRLNAITLPIRRLGHEVHLWAFLDLYDLLKVTHGDITDFMRVTSIEHVLTPGKWHVRLGFTDDGKVSSPASVPGLSAENTNAEVQDSPLYGRVAITPYGAGVWTDTWVTFDPPFEEAPLGYATWSPANNPTETVLVAVTDAEPGGMTVWVRREGTALTYVNWQAIPQ